jgi:ubiquinone/menaquinone biosynthesis C-methylase UbiE
MRRAEGVFEHLDGALPEADLAASLADLERLNAWFGGHRLTVREVARRVARIPRERRLVVVDVGGGRGDLAVHLVRWARGAGRSIRVIVLDRDATTAALARRHCAAHPEVVVVQGDATALPLREAGVDLAVAVLTLHHLDPDAAVTMLGEMRAATRDALIVNDLQRSRMAWLLVWLTTRLFARHPISHHDGPLSVRRAYSVEELTVLADKARLANVRIRRHPWGLRVLLVASP